MRICISGFFGWGNVGDEGILQAIMDACGRDNEFIVSTTLPFDYFEEYHKVLGKLEVEEIRSNYDTRIDFDLFILGGGELNWGFGWRQALAAFTAGIPCVNLGVGYRSDRLFDEKLIRLYYEFLNQFNAITLRDRHSYNLIRRIDAIANDLNEFTSDLSLKYSLSMCPAINLKEEKWDGCPENMVVVCPRFEDDYTQNPAQVKWLVEELKKYDRDEIVLAPFSPWNKQQAPVDLALCKEIKLELDMSLYHAAAAASYPRRMKYLISRSKRVISGGRYHAVVWAYAHRKPCTVYPKALENYPKIQYFIEMTKEFAKLGNLNELERKNREILEEMMKK